MKTDIYENITNLIHDAIERGAEKFEMPWHSKDASLFAPVNATTGKAYRGVNVLALAVTAHERAYGSNEWATYQQWTEAGAQVRKGEKSTHIVFWSQYEKKGPGGEPDGEGNQAEKETGMFAKAYSVFNAAQVDGYTPKAILDPFPASTGPGEQIPECDQFFKNMGIDLRHGGDRAFFNPADDYVQLPNFQDFKCVEGYYSTLAHEATHWTGAKSRLERDLSGRFGNAQYAMEELIAELGAAFTMSNLGLANEPRHDHASYIQSWLKALKNDKRAIFTASSKAQQAADFMLEMQTSPALDLTEKADRLHYESTPQTIGKSDWKIVVKDSDYSGRATEYLFRPAGKGGAWKPGKEHPNYNINDGQFLGLPKGLLTIYRDNHEQIEAAVSKQPIPSPRQPSFSF